MSPTFTRDDLLAAYLDVKRWRRAPEDLRSDYRRRYDALSAAFGVDLDVAFTRSPERWLEQLFRQTVDAFIAVPSPLGGYLEVPPPVIEMSRAHGARVRAAEDELHAAYFELMADALGQLWRLPADRTVTAEELVAQGFDPFRPGPDPLDYV